jgi:hypothetical protein
MEVPRLPCISPSTFDSRSLTILIFFTSFYVTLLVHLTPILVHLSLSLFTMNDPDVVPHANMFVCYCLLDWRDQVPRRCRFPHHLAGLARGVEELYRAGTEEIGCFRR